MNMKPHVNEYLSNLKKLSAERKAKKAECEKLMKEALAAYRKYVKEDYKPAHKAVVDKFRGLRDQNAAERKAKKEERAKLMEVKMAKKAEKAVKKTDAKAKVPVLESVATKDVKPAKKATAKKMTAKKVTSKKSAQKVSAAEVIAKGEAAIAEAKAAVQSTEATK